MLLGFVPQSPKFPLAVLPLGSVLSATGRTGCGISAQCPACCSLCQEWQFTNFQAFRDNAQGRNYQSLHFLVTAWTFKVIFLVLLRKKWGLYIHSHLVLCLGFFFPQWQLCLVIAEGVPPCLVPMVEWLLYKWHQRKSLQSHAGSCPTGLI